MAQQLARHIVLRDKKPGIPASGDAWYEVYGTSPHRTMMLCVQDGEDVIRIPVATW